VVGEFAEREARQALATEDDPPQRRRQLLGRFDPAGEQRSVLGAGFLGGGGDGGTSIRKS
jgi:hypothetical protein